MSGVITVTVAPSIDRTYHVDALRPGEVHRAHRVTEEFAGKGVNVSHGLALGNVFTRAVVPLPPSTWSTYGHDRPWLVFSPASVSPRVSITVLDDGGRTTKINQLPPALSAADWAALVSVTGEEISSNKPQWVAMCGAIPRLDNGDEIDSQEIASLAKAAGAQFALDTSGPAFTRWVRAGVPDVVKPNVDELAECVGRNLNTLGDVVDAGRELCDWGVGAIAVSLGADGMVGIRHDAVVYARSEAVDVKNTIGAGDASLAGLLAHLVSHPADFSGAIANAVAWGGAKVSQSTSQLTDLTRLPHVVVSESIDPDTALSEPSKRH